MILGVLIDAESNFREILGNDLLKDFRRKKISQMGKFFATIGEKG